MKRGLEGFARRRVWRKIILSITILVVAMGLAIASQHEERSIVHGTRVVEASSVSSIVIGDILGDTGGSVINGTLTIYGGDCGSSIDAFIAHTDGSVTNITVNAGENASMAFNDPRDVLTIMPSRKCSVRIYAEAVVSHRRFLGLSILGLALFIAATAYALKAVTEYIAELASAR